MILKDIIKTGQQYTRTVIISLSSTIPGALLLSRTAQHPLKPPLERGKWSGGGGGGASDRHNPEVVLSFLLRPICQNIVTWPHPATKEARR